MFFSTVFTILMIPFILLFVLAFPLVIGVLVYRDASKRVDASPWLWALVAALAPSFVGVIIYLIVRNDYPLKDGYNQSRQRGDSSYFEEEYDNRAVEPKTGMPTWAKVLLIISVIVGAIIIIAGIVGIAQYLFGFGGFHRQYYGF